MVGTHPTLESRKENRCEEGIPYAVGVHVDAAGTAVPEGFELLGRLLRAGERTDCSGQALNCSVCWTRSGTPHGVHDALLRAEMGRRENRWASVGGGRF